MLKTGCVGTKMNQKYNDFIAKELSRKDFLKFIGGGVVVLLGMNNFISYLTRYNQPKSQEMVESSHGFGSRKFGG